MADFKLAILKTATNEGGYVNDAADRGGETKYGISRRAYPDLDIANITWRQARELYRHDYWDKLQLSGIEDQAIAEQIFDHGVNAGIRAGALVLQEAYNLLAQKNGLRLDGVIGRITISAVNGFSHQSDLLAAIKGLRFTHYYRIAATNIGQRSFFRGWLRRIEI